MANQSPDFIARFAGSMGQIQPVTPAAKNQLDDNVESEPWQWLGQWLSIDHRYFLPLLEGIESHGLLIEVRQAIAAPAPVGGNEVGGAPGAPPKTSQEIANEIE